LFRRYASRFFALRVFAGFFLPHTLRCLAMFDLDTSLEHVGHSPFAGALLSIDQPNSTTAIAGSPFHGSMILLVNIDFLGARI